MSAEEQQKKDLFYMSKALEQARIALDADEIPIGAVIVCGDRIIARASNLTEALHDVTAHAEMQPSPLPPTFSVENISRAAPSMSPSNPA